MERKTYLTFDQILRALESKHGFTEKEILQKLRIARSTYRGWRDGYSEPSKREHYIRLAEVFCTSLEALIKGRGIDPKRETPWFLKSNFSGRES